VASITLYVFTMYTLSYVHTMLKVYICYRYCRFLTYVVHETLQLLRW